MGVTVWLSIPRCAALCQGGWTLLRPPSWFSSFLSSQREGQRGWGVHSLLVSLCPSGIPWQFTFPHGHSSSSLTTPPVTDMVGFRDCPLSSRPRRPQIPFCPACSPRGMRLDGPHSRDLVHLQSGMLSGMSREESRSTVTEAAHVKASMFLRQGTHAQEAEGWASLACFPGART